MKIDAVDSSGFSLALAGGGTGGHLLPGLHLLAWFQRLERRPTRVIWFTAGRAIEERVFRQHEPGDYAFERVALALEPSGGGAPSIARTVLRAGPETLRARRALRRSKARVLVGLGGYTSVPAILAAKSLGLPIVLLEINATIGRATRAASGLASVVVHAWPASVPPGAGARHRVLGPPLAPVLADDLPPATEARLVVLGGSQGALGLNRFVAEHAAALVRGGFEIVHQVGPGRLREAAPPLAGYTAVEYVDDVPALLATARLALVRGGASTLAEVAARRVPAVVVPYPHHADRHQAKNAAALGAGVEIVEESALSTRTVARLLALGGEAGGAERARMRAALEQAFDREAGRRLAELVGDLALGPAQIAPV
ncbi:MAG: UDP-N-acetylglucosamine--N-acetylmuramyl-(pentapeptide) pyrophosphoryl-undecaprenol N-acetylglucosamine transferase [Planctomycetota bacterium]